MPDQTLTHRIASAAQALCAKVAPAAAAARRFRNNIDENLFLGVFDSYEEAAAQAPTTRPLGYDNPESAALYLRRLHIDTYDYPALFWLSQSLAAGLHDVVDIGGSVGIKFYAFAKFLNFPSQLRWRVIDVPAVAERGRAFARERGAPPALEFAHALSAADGFDVLYASGSLQYLPQTLAQTLAGFARKPRRIIVNTMPCHPSRTYYTLNSVGTAVCPYRVEHADTFVYNVTSSGYRLRDEWRNKGKRLQIPFHLEESLEEYCGFCFDANS